MVDLLLIFSLGFLGSFGHCAGMCGPLTVAFSLSQQQDAIAPTYQLRFHGLLNLGRLLSYALVGAGIGALGSVLVAGGQMAGIGSVVRQGMAWLTGILLIGAGLAQVSPTLLPRLPFLHPLLQGKLHERLSKAMVKLSLQNQWWTPLLLGLVWGLIPCGFLYTAQLKAAETGNVWAGGLTMLAFGLGTFPMMLGVGVSASRLSADRRSQLFRIGGWVTLTIGVLTLLRTGSMMVDHTGYAALVCLGLALIARPISRLWTAPMRFRRVLGVGAFILAVAHTAHMIDHAWKWNFRAFFFMLPQHQWGILTGTIALLCMMPAAFTSFDWMQKMLGHWWRSIHLLTVPALVLTGIHCILIGSRYLGTLQPTQSHQLATLCLSLIVLLVLMVRSRWLWQRVGLEKFYVLPSVASRTATGKDKIVHSD
jgi:sulfite exporter TauE/SafE